MNETSPIATGTATAAMTIVVPILSWVADSFHVSIPENVQLSLAVVIVTGAHWLSRTLAARAAAKHAAAPTVSAP
jgi:hypothetical protein